MRKRHFSITLNILAVLIFIFSINTAPFAQEPAKDAKKDTAAKEGAKNAPKTGEEEVTGWRIKDFKPYLQALKELYKLSREYSDNLLKLAIDEYATGLDILEDMENEVNKLITYNKDKKNLNERWYWQEADRKSQEERQILKLKYESKLKSITYFTRAINHIDAIQFQEVKKDPKYQNFQIRLYQVYVSTQYDIHNLKPCIPILERYITFNEATKKDVWAYKYLTSCYGYMEAVVAKYKGAQASEEVVLHYKQMKNQYMLQSVELQYGVDSPEYKHLKDTVEQDEKKSEKINDFK